jgi:diguanylate cyclase (GGDEF)-like protein
MTRLPFNSSALRGFLTIVPWLILVGGLGITFLMWQHERQVTHTVLRSQFDFALRETVNRIEQRVQGYEQMLRGVQSLFATTSFKNRAAFRDYVDSLQLGANFSGVQAIGLVEWIPSHQLSDHISSMRAGGFPSYTIEPNGEREAYAPIVQREPYVGRNRAPVGGDIWNDPVRRYAAEKARDSGMTAISGKVILMVSSDVPDAPPGFIMYLPIYAHGSEHATIEQRRASQIGWIYASFHMNDFMASLYGQQTPGLALAIYDGTDAKESSLLYRSTDGNVQSRTPGISANEYLVVAGHNWTLSLDTLSPFEERYGRGTETQTAAAGVIVSLLLTVVVWLTINGRARAMRLAETMTEQLRHAAQHDALTGLPNRALFSDRLDREIARAQRHNGSFALIFLDLDNFKPINDNYGHPFGDQVLQQVGFRLQSCIRDEDTVGRIGGDEFVMLLAGTSTSEATMKLAEKIQEAVRAPLTVQARQLTISCSIGVAIYPQDGTDPISLTKSADQAMYRAKSEGRDCVRLSLEPFDNKFQ